jgi:hypothetical protein
LVKNSTLLQQYVGGRDELMENAVSVAGRASKKEAGISLQRLCGLEPVNAKHRHRHTERGRERKRDVHSRPTMLGLDGQPEGFQPSHRRQLLENSVFVHFLQIDVNGQGLQSRQVLRDFAKGIRSDGDVCEVQGGEETQRAESFYSLQQRDGGRDTNLSARKEGVTWGVKVSPTPTSAKCSSRENTVT